MIEPFDKAFATEDLQEVEYDGKNMNAPQILMDFLDHNLTKVFDFVMSYTYLFTNRLIACKTWLDY